MSVILDYFLKQQSEIRRANDQLILKIIRAFQVLFRSVQPNIENVRLTLEANPKMTKAQIVRTGAYVDLIAQVSREIDDFATYTKVEVQASGIEGAALAVKHLRDFYGMNDIQATIIPPDALDVLAELLAPDGALSKRIEMWAPHAAEQVSKAIKDGAALGRNPRKIAADITKAYGVGLTDALRTTRTAQLYAYREATRLNYLANSNFIKGWIWLTALDDRTCMSCIAMHGTTHTLDEVLNDHHGGRCTMVPIIEGVDYELLDSKEWFDALDEAQKIKQMGAGKYSAYKDGLITLPQLTTTYLDPVYGEMRAETALKDLFNG